MTQYDVIPWRPGHLKTTGTRTGPYPAEAAAEEAAYQARQAAGWEGWAYIVVKHRPPEQTE